MYSYHYASLQEVARGRRVRRRARRGGRARLGRLSNI